MVAAVSPAVGRGAVSAGEHPIVSRPLGDREGLAERPSRVIGEPQLLERRGLRDAKPRHE